MKIADAYGLSATAITRRPEVGPAIEAARRLKSTAILEFRVEQEDTVYLMVPAGADLHAMIRRPSPPVGNRGGCVTKPHTFVVTVEDLPGVLNCISSPFRRRGFNIESLTVGHTERPGVSRMTFVVLTDDAGAERFQANVYKLVNVILSVADITARPAVFRELAMIKVTAPQERRPEIVHLAEVFRARIIDLAPDSLTIEITGEARSTAWSTFALRRRRDGAHRATGDDARRGRTAGAVGPAADLT